MGSKKKWGKFTKVMKFGNPTDIQAWNRMQHDEARRKELGTAQAAADARNKAGNQAADRAQELRDLVKRLYRPMERSLSAEVLAGYNPDYEQISGQAKDDVGQSFARGVGGYNRNAARLGVLADDDGGEIERLRGLDETASKVFASNNAVNRARDRAENLTATRGAQLVALGQQRPYLASQESLAGNSALADILDYQTMERANRGADRRAGDVQGGQAIASIFGGMADGGVVKNPAQYGIGKPPINGMAKRVYADGGGVTRPRRELGGAVGETARLANMHREEYGAGKTDKPFGQWLEENGYELGDDNMARPKGSDKTAAVTTGADDRPRTPDFLFQPLKNKPTRNFAVGGLIEEAPVDMETGDYVMPADVVHKLGTEYFDNLVTMYAADDSDDDSKVGLADGGLVGGIRPGQGLANLASGFKDGQMDYRRMKAFDEDREYLREERAYLAEQRKKSEAKAAYERDLDFATARFVKSDGVDLASIIDVQKKYAGDNGQNLLITPNQDGSTFSLATVGPDGNPSGIQKQVTKEDLRSIGMNMIEALRDPRALIKSWNEKPTTVSTAEGAVTNAWNPRNRKWEQVASNPKDQKANTDKYNPQRAYDQISRLIGERLGGKYDDITGKIIKPPDDPELATKLTAAGHQYERENPGSLAPGEVVNNLFNKVAGAVREDDAKKMARKEISEKTGYFSTDETDLGMPRKEYEAKRVKELTGGGDFGLGVGAPAPAPAATAKPAAAPKPLRAPPGFKPTMVQAVNAMGRGKDPKAVAARLKEMGHSDAEVQATLEFYKQNARR